MRILNLLIPILLLAFNINAQAPLVKQWDKRFGSLELDMLQDFQQTSDGGYILAGISAGDIGGDKTQNICGNVSPYFWIVKIDAQGNKQWDKSIGCGAEELGSIQQTTDGGYILGGQAPGDFWIVKIDFNGNEQWNKKFGGTLPEYLESVEQSVDGGYIVAGTSLSDANGDKTEPSRGGQDYWILKTDSAGNKLWDRRFGGSGVDYLRAMRVTPDGGCILGGSSGSLIGGDKSQQNWGGHSHGWDWWVVKVDVQGNKEWDRRFGGATPGDALHTIELTADGGYILGGNGAGSAGDGDRTQFSVGETDYWLVKIDAQGNKLWDRNFGGEKFDGLGHIVRTFDGGYLLSGASESPMGGDKSEDNLSEQQVWMVKTDACGNKQWDKTIFTLANSYVWYDDNGTAIQGLDSSYTLGIYTEANVGGYTTQPSWGYGDYWLVNFLDTSSYHPPALVAYATCINISCLGAADGKASMIVCGGMEPYRYLWSNGEISSVVTHLSAGTYTVTVTDSAGATATDSVVIHEPSAISIPITLQTNISCLNAVGSASVVPSGGSGSYHILWSTGRLDYNEYNLTAGSYMITVTDANGCTASTSVMIIEDSLLNTVEITGDSIRDISQPAIYYVNAGSTFVWSVNNGRIISGQYTNNIQVEWDSVGQGIVQVIVSSDSCTDTLLKAVTLITTTDIQENPFGNFSFYPNPTSEIITLKTRGTYRDLQLQLFDTFGKELWTQRVQVSELQTEFELNFSDLPNALYFLTISNAQARKVFKIIKM